jgi:hypothetical protein
MHLVRFGDPAAVGQQDPEAFSSTIRPMAASGYTVKFDDH